MKQRTKTIIVNFTKFRYGTVLLQLIL